MLITSWRTRKSGIYAGTKTDHCGHGAILRQSRPGPGDCGGESVAAGRPECVRKASLLLRLRAALNLGRSAAVRGNPGGVADSRVNLVLLARPRASVDLERGRWKRKKLFLEVFGREL